MKYSTSNPIERKKAEARFKLLIEKGKDIELKEVKRKRTIKQNSFLHVVISLFAIEFGYNLEEAKTHLKRSCDFMRYTKNNEVFLKRTRDMDTKELTTFIEWVRNHSAENGLYIPTAEEYLLNQFEVDREIQRNKEFL